MFWNLLYGTSAIDTFAQVQQCHLTQFQKIFHAMLEEGIYLAPSDMKQVLCFFSTRFRRS